jgi:DNA-binding transcriptional LysR family regulator
MLQAIRAGLGKSLLPCFVADGACGLRRLSAEVALSRELWLLTHGELRHQARMASVVAWLADVVAARLTTA